MLHSKPVLETSDNSIFNCISTCETLIDLSPIWSLLHTAKCTSGC